MSRPRFGLLCALFVLTSCAGRRSDQPTTPAPAPSAAAAPAPLRPEDAEVDLSVARREVPADGPWRGSAEPLVTIVAFTDFECPFCARVLPTLAELLERYPEVRLVVRMAPLPFHLRAVPAAEAALEAYAQGGNEAFFRMHDRLFENQLSLERAHFVAYASQAGLDVARFGAALDDHRHRAAVDADSALAGEVGASGTPTFFVNGRMIRGAQPYEVFEEVVRSELAAAESLVGRGLPRGDVYAAFMHAARVRSSMPEYAEVEEPPPPSPGPIMIDDPNAVFRIPVGDDPTLGPADALVTLVEFGDFECPFCDRARGTLEELRRRYGNRLRIVWKNNPLPFHANAMLAAIAAEEAYAQGGNRAFWAMHERLMAHHRELDRSLIERVAAEVGLDVAKLASAFEADSHRSSIEAESELAQSVGANGTPTFFVNGRVIRGAQPIDSFVQLIDEELDEAKARVRSGARRSSLYETIIADGHTTPQLVERAPTPPGPGPDHVYELPIPRHRPSQGPARAPVVIQEVTDFQCPYCARAQPTLAALRERYGDRIRLVVRDYPLSFHVDAALAAEAAYEIFLQRGDEAYFRYAERLFASQDALGRAELERHAEELGRVHMGRFRRALDRRTHRAVVARDVAAVEASGAPLGTPSFFVNGRLLQGAQPLESFVELVDAALREAGVEPPAGEAAAARAEGTEPR